MLRGSGCASTWSPEMKEVFLPMHVVYRKDALPGPAGRALISQLQS
jgi:hypothetical protein